MNTDQGKAGFYIVINGDKLKNYLKKQQHQQMNINNDTSGQKKLDGNDDTTDQVTGLIRIIWLGWIIINGSVRGT